MEKREIWKLTVLAVALASLLLAGCVDEEARQSSPPDTATAGDSVAGGDALSGDLEEGEPFTLDRDRPVPPRFEGAYRSGVPIVVEFFQQGRDPYFPQGLEVGEMVNEDLTALRDDYPRVEFFTYDIDNPGEAQESEDLERGEYGTLAAQLEVGYTPFVAMLAPREEGYVVNELYGGYVDRGVLDQELLELANVRSDPELPGE